MSERKTTEELLQIAKLRVKELEKRNSKEQRKKRTKRLIETGALIESILGEIDLQKLKFALTKSKDYILNIINTYDTNGIPH